MSIFEFENYKKYVKSKVSEMPNKGRGQFLKMANFLSVSPVTVSQIFKGNRDLTIEQGCELSEFFGHTQTETEYFVNLIEYERAGTQKLKMLITGRLEALREKSQVLKHRIKHQVQLSEEAKAIFYSQWYYSGVRLLTSIEGFQTPEAIAHFLDLPIRRVTEILYFLVSQGLCVEDKNKFRMGPSSTHIGADHHLVTRHHANWRFKVIEKLNHISANELCLTMPCVISEKSIKAIRKELVEVIERITKEIDESPSEVLTCINIDLYKV